MKLASWLVMEVELATLCSLPLPMEELDASPRKQRKQILFQKVRDAVRNNVYEQYIDKTVTW